MLYIYCFNLPNGSYFGAIWKHRQFLQFPRLNFHRKILYFQHSSAYAYIRKLDLARMRHPHLLPVTNYPATLQEQFQWQTLKDYYEGRNVEQGFNSLFLNDSYSINFTYSGGDFCGAPINKQR